LVHLIVCYRSLEDKIPEGGGKQAAQCVDLAAKDHWIIDHQSSFRSGGKGTGTQKIFPAQFYRRQKL